jgi:hypothetical protein
VTPSDLILKLIYSMINVIPFFLLTGKRFYFFLRDLIMLMLIEVSSINGTRKKIANGLAKLNYNVISLNLSVKELASRGDIHSACSVSSHDSVRVMIVIIVAAATISFLSVNPGYVSMAFTVPGLTSYSTPLNAISPYSVEQGNQLYQTPLLTLGTGRETLSEQEPSETASISSVSSSVPSSSPTSSTGTTSSSSPSTTTNQAPTTSSSTGTPSTTPQSSGPTEGTPAPTPPPTTSPSSPSTQQQMSSIYQQPAAPQVPSTIQQLPAQPLIQTTPQTQSLLQNNPAQPIGIPSTTATIQPQLSALPPTATTFPPSVFPPVNSLQPYGTIGSTGSLGYPSTTAGQYGLGAAGTAAGAAATSVGTSSQLVSPWFPSLPATYCGGTFLLTIEGTPRGNGDNDKIEPADNSDKNDDNSKDDRDDDDNNHKNSKDSDREKRLLSLQINSDNTRIFTDDDAIFGEIFLGKKNIDKNKGNDFDIKSIFNDCQVVTYSKS